VLLEKTHLVKSEIKSDIMNIACVIPTIREKSLAEFVKAWKPLIKKHHIDLIIIRDGDNPILSHNDIKMNVKDVMGQFSHLIYNKSDCVRNLGFAYIAKYLPDINYILTLDDDVLPIGDPIEAHLTALKQAKPINWLSTIIDEYPRGFPYGIREEAEVVLSHGIWRGVADWDAPTQLVKGNHPVKFYKGPIPKGIYYPMCGMNIMFKRKMLPYMYYAPMGHRVGMDRFADIWLGIISKRIADKKGWAVMTGYAEVLHKRASNVWANLKKEAIGLELNEDFWQGIETHPYFKVYNKTRKQWEKLIINYDLR